MTGVTAAQSLVVRPAARLRGELTLPGDKSISHRALMLAALAAGQSRIEGAGDGADVRSTAAICAALGAALHARSNDSLPPVTVIGRSPLHAVDVSTTVPSAQVKSAILLAACGR